MKTSLFFSACLIFMAVWVTSQVSDAQGTGLTITCPPPITVQCIGDVPSPDIASVTASSDCGGPIVVIHLGDFSNGNICPEVITRSYQATDDCGNQVICTQTITISDDVPPVLSCPAPVTVLSIDDIPDPDPNIVSAVDNCGWAHVDFVRDDYSSDQVSRIYGAWDACNNYAECSQLFMIAEILYVTNTANSGSGSLYQAITDANADPGLTEIAFNIPGAGPHTIIPTNNLPNITSPVIIDGYTQLGASPNTNPPNLESNAILKIVIDGTNAAPYERGLYLGGSNSVIRGLVIQNFKGFGIHVQSHGNIIEGNFIGIDVTGTTAQGNAAAGILLLGSDHNLIGGTTPQARNIISGTQRGNFAAIEYGEGIYISIFCDSNVVQGNFIGTDVTGTIDLGNSKNGIYMERANHNVIGGTTLEERNIISGNGRNGVSIFGCLTEGYCGSSDYNRVEGNYIGVDINGAPLGNNKSGVELGMRVHHNVIGGDTEEAGNVIAFNGENGVALLLSYSPVSNCNTIRANSIFSNSLLGIDVFTSLIAGIVNPNDLNDVDYDVNSLQNYPVLLSAIADQGSIFIEGTLNSSESSSLGGTPYLIDLYYNSQCDPSNHGEGEVYVGSVTATIPDGSNDVHFIASFPFDLTPGNYLSATATNACGATSEFSECCVILEDMDSDGDGIYNLVDTEPADSSGEFSDQLTGGSAYGWIVTKGDQVITVSEEPNPAGIRISADPSGGALPAVFNTCGGFPIELNAGEETVIDCASLILKAVVGPIDILLGSGQIATVPSGGSVIIHELGAGQSSVENLPESESAISVSIDGITTELQPGESTLVALPEGPPICTITPDTLEFGTVAVGNYLEKSFTIRNSGGHLLSGVVNSLCDEYEVIAGSGTYNIIGGDSLHVRIRFSPVESGHVTCEIECGSLECQNVWCVGDGYIVPVTLDIKPGACPNPVNITWMRHYNEENEHNENVLMKKGGVLPVALVGSEQFDVSLIDASSLLLNGIAPLRHDYEDVTSPASGTDRCACVEGQPDGFDDLTLKFRLIDIIATLGTVSDGESRTLTLTGTLLDGTPIRVSDCVLLHDQPMDEPTTLESDEANLSPASPNPFNPTTTIAFNLPATMRATVSIYDPEGRLVKTLIEDTLNKGKRTVTWDGTDSNGSPVASGIYFCRLRAADKVFTRKIVLIK